MKFLTADGKKLGFNVNHVTKVCFLFDCKILELLETMALGVLRYIVHFIDIVSFGVFVVGFKFFLPMVHANCQKWEKLSTLGLWSGYTIDSLY